MASRVAELEVLIREEFDGQNRGEATMDSMKSDTISVDQNLEGFIDLWKLMFGFMYSLGLRWAVELEIPDIIAKCGPESTLSAEEIAGFLPSPSPNIDFLSRTLSFLATRGIFSQTLMPNSPIKYGLTPISKWLVKDTDNGGAKEGTFAPWLLLHTHEAVITPWYRLGESILSGSGFPFELVHGKLLFSLAESNPELGRLFNEAMGTYSKILVKDILAAYGDGFRKLEFMSLVDVGGGNGSTISAISRSFPNIKCCNFDLPEVISEAHSYAGVQHIAGDMFVSVPNADAIFMKGHLFIMLGREA
ncbi:(R,S)-reticuline 7-O-methyltransferase isoform X2 [Cryptomeria japonica]|uniref:(R,S)-reticuline 7-O-methyltransferase isoform X2 n=1 Tax=Cryptomeria japonica TaxID=3369 RepID=UPI0027DA29A5|nr:(R,S)-reticuline 7-O-methyltransferase isoform X2 [Cryptomeria japonica]